MFQFFDRIFNSEDYNTPLNNERKNRAMKKLAYYSDNQLPFLQEELALHFDNPDELTPCFVNIVKKIVNLKAQAYKEPPRRTIEKGYSQDQELLKEVAKDSQLDLVMKTASRYTKLLKTVLLRPVWRNGRLDIDLLTPDVLDVVTGDSPRDLEEVIITRYSEDGRPENTTYSHWTKDKVELLDANGNIIHSEWNVYKILPFVPLWDRVPTGSDFFLEGSDDLIVIQDAINEKLTDLLYTVKMQSFGVGWLRNGENNKNSLNQIQVSPGSMIELNGPDSAVGFESQKAEIEQVINSIDTLISWAAITNGISSSSISEKHLEESGVSRVIESKELDDLRRDDIEMFRLYEKQLFDVIKTVWNTHNNYRKFSAPCTITLDFIDPISLNNINDLVASYDNLIALNCASPIDLVMKLNPDLKTREQAKEFLDMVKEENKQYQTLGVTDAEDYTEEFTA